MANDDDLEPLVDRIARALRGMWRARPEDATGLVVNVSLSGASYVYARYLVREREPLPPHDAREVGPLDLERRRRGETIDPWLAAVARDSTDAFGEVVEALSAYAARHRTWWHARAPVELALLRLRAEGVFDAAGPPALLAIWASRADEALAACNRGLNPDWTDESLG
ncbi:MAG: hypothetical protein KF901_11340 [Myxococcales bacterium]|nr:hypothetical protein [Myxococcales bacterium]